MEQFSLISIDPIEPRYVLWLIPAAFIGAIIFLISIIRSLIAIRARSVHLEDLQKQAGSKKAFVIHSSILTIIAILFVSTCYWFLYPAKEMIRLYGPEDSLILETAIFRTFRWYLYISIPTLVLGIAALGLIKLRTVVGNDSPGGQDARQDAGAPSDPSS